MDGQFPHHAARSALTNMRSYTMYQPMRVFLMGGELLVLVGLVPAVRFLYFALVGEGMGHIQSLIFAAVFLIVGFQVLLIGLLADLVAYKRKMSDEMLYRLRKLELAGGERLPDEADPERRRD